MSHHHGHPGDGPSAPMTERRVLWAMGLNAVVVALQVGVGLWVSSIALLSDAAHNLTDVVGLAVSFAAIRLTRRAPTPQLSFGWHRSTTLAAWVNGTLVLAAAGWIVVESAGRLAAPPPVSAWPVVVVAAAGAVVNGAAAVLVGGGRASERDPADLNRRGAWLHLVSDAAVSVVVAAAGLVMALSGSWGWLDPAAAIAVACVVAWHAASLLWATGAVLLEATPDDIQLAALRRVVTGVAGVIDVHDVHVWTLSHEVRALSAHLVVESSTLDAAQHIVGQVKAALRDELRIGHATLELEAVACESDHDECSIAAIPEPARGTR